MCNVLVFPRLRLNKSPACFLWQIPQLLRAGGYPLELKGRRLDGNVETFRPSKSLFRAHEYEERVQVLLFLPQSNPGAMNDNINWVNCTTRYDLPIKESSYELNTQFHR